MKSIEQRLSSWRRTKGCLGTGAAAFPFLVGLVVVFLTFWLSYGIIWVSWVGLAANPELIWAKRFHLVHEYRLLFSGIFVVMLFVYYFRTSPRYWNDYDLHDFALGAATATHRSLAVPQKWRHVGRRLANGTARH